MNYLQLFSISVQHDYYADQCCGDFLIEATPETKTLLANLRCLIRPLANGLRVLIQVADQGALKNTPFIALPSNASFTFMLRLQNAHFGLFTDLSATAHAALPLFVNNGDSGALSLQAADAPGKLAKDVFAYVRVNIATPENVAVEALSDESHAFTLQFKAKKYRWKYYIVTDKVQAAVDQLSQLSIEDKDKAIIFDAADTTDLTQFPDPSDLIAVQLARQYPDLRLFRLCSNTAVPCQQAARKSIQLMVNGEKALTALANPQVQNFVSDEKNGIKEEALYQVVNYFARF